LTNNKTHSAAIPALLAALKVSAPSIRQRAAHLIGAIRPTSSEVITALINAMDDCDPDVSSSAVESLRWVGGGRRDAAFALSKVVAAPKRGRSIRFAAAQALMWTDDSDLAIRTSFPEALLELTVPPRQIGAAALQRIITSPETELPTLLQLLHDDSPSIRAFAAQRLGAGRHTHAVAHLIAQLKDVDDEARYWAGEALISLGVFHPEAAIIVIQGLADRDRYPFSLQALTRADPGVIPFLVDNLCHPDSMVPIGVLFVLANFGKAAAQARDAVFMLMNDKNADTLARSLAAKAYLSIGGDSASALSALFSMALQEHTWYVTQGFIAAGEQAIPALRELLTNPSYSVRAIALSALGSLGPRAASVAPEVISLLRSSDPRIRSSAAYVLGEMAVRTSEVESALQEMLTDEDRYVRSIALRMYLILGFDANRLSPRRRITLREAIVRDTIEEKMRDLWDHIRVIPRVGAPPILPEFPWPPPPYSVADYIPPHLIGPPSMCLGEVFDHLSSQFRTANLKWNVYYLRDGFVLATDLHAMKHDGTSKPGSYLIAHGDQPWGTFLERLGHLVFGSPRGKYRIIVFVVTTRSGYSAGKEQEPWRGQWEKAAYYAALPKEVAKLPYEGRHLYVLVYQYERGPGELMRLAPSSLTALEHLNKAGIRVGR